MFPTRGRGAGSYPNNPAQQNSDESRQNAFDSSSVASKRGGGFGRGGSSNFQRDTVKQSEVLHQNSNVIVSDKVRGFLTRGGGFSMRGGGFSKNVDDQQTRGNFSQRGRGGTTTFEDNGSYRQGGSFGTEARGGFAQSDNNINFDQRPTRGNFTQRGRGTGGNVYEQSGVNEGFGQQQSTRGSFGNFGSGRGASSRGFGNHYEQQVDGESGFAQQQSTRGNYGGRGGFNSNRDFDNNHGEAPRRDFDNNQHGGDGFSSRRGSFNPVNSAGNRACYNCGQNDHMSRDCPEPRKPRDDQRGMTNVFSDRQSYGNRGGSFQPRFDDNEARRPSSNFVPNVREVDEIYKDDENVDAANDEFYQQDMEVTVENGPENLAIFETWEESGLMPQLLENIKRSRYPKPRLFQKYTIPLILEGNDVKGQSETGSGKSAAFLLPIINVLAQSFNENPDDTRRLKVSALIIEPTRELAKQLYEQGVKFADKTGVTVNFAYGEYNMGVNKKSLHEKGCDILVGTPGRLKGLLKDNFFKVDTLQFLVLDEADRLLDCNFMDEIVEMTKVSGFSPVDERQTLFFSATFSPEAIRYANELCKKNSVLVRNTKTGVSVRIEQQFLHVPVNKRKEYLLDMFKKEMTANNGVLPKKLVFVETKRDADYIATLLSDDGIKAQTVNGDRTQNLREEATEGFRKGDYSVLVTTNVFARGMNFTDLGQVINMYLPTDRDTYVHRIGRTARLKTGVATSFFDPEYQTDRDFAPILIDELGKSGHEVPDFIRAAVDSSVNGFDNKKKGFAQLNVVSDAEAKPAEASCSGF